VSGADSDEIRAVRDDISSPVHRALAILELLGSDEVSDSLGVVEIARRLGRDKSQVSRALRLLADIGFVDREPRTLRYRIGTRLFAVAAKAIDRRLREEADQVTTRLAALLGERVEVLVRCGAEAVTISSAAPGQMLLAVGWVGRTQPLPSTAAGRCLLFDSEDEEIARLLAVVGIEGAGPQVPRSLDEVVQRVRTDSARGVSICVQESDREFLAIGVPVRDVHARTVAGLQVCGPQRRMEEVMDETIKQAIAAAQVISAALGGPGRRPPTAPSPDTRSVTGKAGA
jgi:DNA-binding IclR family transcriptional regulator